MKVVFVSNLGIHTWLVVLSADIEQFRTSLVFIAVLLIFPAFYLHVLIFTDSGVTRQICVSGY